MKKNRENLDLRQVSPAHELQSYRSAIEATRDMDKIATVMDKWMLDGLSSFVAPVVADVISSAALAIYTLFKAKQANLNKNDQGKIVMLHILDGLVGAVPVVGDFADFFWRSNTRAAKLFHAKVKELEKSLVSQGLTKTEIEDIRVLIEEKNPLVEQSLRDLEQRILAG